MKRTVLSFAAALALAVAAAPQLANAGMQVVAAKPAARTITVHDTVVGKGKPATPGSTVTIHYSGWLYSPNADKQHGAQFDSSVGGAPFTFQLGAGKVIKGMDEGVTGMAVGGKRTIIIPAELGYGARAAGPIPPNANLIFDVELVGVK